MKLSPSPQDRKIIKLLEALKAIKAEYPPEMLARRRTTYMVQLALMEKFSVKNFDSIEDEKIIEVLENLKPVRAEYPSILMAKQRAAFLDRAAKRRKTGRIESLRSAIRSKLSFTLRTPGWALTNALRRSFILASIIAAVFAGILFGNLDRFTESARPQPTSGEISRPVSIIPTATYEGSQTTCTPDSTSLQCSIYGFDKEPGQTTWVSKSADSWIKIDTGQTATIHMVEFDKKYLGESTGEFTISLALFDNVYKQVYDSKSDDSTETFSRGGTIQASFEPELARYVLITVTDPGMAINEVRAFAVNQPPTATPPQVSRNTKEPPLPTLTSSSTPLPTRTKTATLTGTPLLSSTATATPTGMPSPSSTSTAKPTGTPSPSNTPTTVPTNTPLPNNTPTAKSTSTSLPASTPLPSITPSPTSTP